MGEQMYLCSNRRWNLGNIYIFFEYRNCRRRRSHIWLKIPEFISLGPPQTESENSTKDIHQGKHYLNTLCHQPGPIHESYPRKACQDAKSMFLTYATVPLHRKRQLRLSGNLVDATTGVCYEHCNQFPPVCTFSAPRTTRFELRTFTWSPFTTSLITLVGAFTDCAFASHRKLLVIDSNCPWRGKTVEKTLSWTSFIAHIFMRKFNC